MGTEQVKPPAATPLYADATIRGLLIIAIVLGHSQLLTEARPAFFVSLYFWHVQGFFILAWTRLDSLQGKRLADRAARYLVPYLWLVVPLGLLRLLLRVDGVTPAALGEAILVGSAPLLDAQIGTALFWFLPTFLGFTAAMMAIGYLRRRHGAQVATLNMALVLLGALNLLGLPDTLKWLPFGIGLVGYLVALSVLHEISYPVAMGQRGTPAAVLVWILVIAILIGEAMAIADGQVVNASIFAFSRPPTFALSVLHALAAVAMNICAFAAARGLSRVEPLNMIGKQSLQIFLFHQFALFPLTKISWFLIGHDLNSGLRTPLGVACAICAICAALAANWVIQRVPAVRQRLFPADWADVLGWRAR